MLDLGIVGLQLLQFLECLHRLVVFAEQRVGAESKFLGLGVARLEFDRAQRMTSGLGRAVQVFEQLGVIEVGLDVVRIEAQCFAKGLLGANLVSNTHADHPETVVGVGGIRFELDHPTQDLDGFGKATATDQGVAQVEPGIRPLRAEFGHPAESPDRGLVLFARQLQHPRGRQGRRVVGCMGKDLVQARRRLVEPLRHDQVADLVQRILDAHDLGHRLGKGLGGRT